jgi:aminoglycoside phosphotransferase (APT) family kinase protein
MEFIEGRILWDQTLPKMTPSQRGAIYAEMNRVIAALHCANFAAQGLAQYGRSGNYFERQIARWSKQYVASVTQPIPEMDQLIAWLPQHIPAMAKSEAMVSIVHGDFRLDNLIFHPTEPRILAVLDWELSTLGSPLADFAYNAMAWRIPPDLFRGLAGSDLPALGIPAEADYVAAYCRRTGRAGFPDLDFYVVFNMFRLAAIMQGIMRRVLEGTAAGADAAANGRLATPLATLGWEEARRASA